MLVDSEGDRPIALKISNVTKIFKIGNEEITILDSLDLQCYENDFLVISGPSGSGKSTILSIIGGMVRPSKGVVNVFEYNLTEDTITEEQLAIFRSTNVGFVFQTGHLIDSLTVYENVLLPVELAQRDDANFRERAWNLLEEFHLEQRANSLPIMISGGEYQRTAFIRALILDPPLLLIDEPTSNQDNQTTEIIINKLRQLSGQKTIIVITHDKKIFPLADKIYIPRDGKLIPFKSD